MRNMVNCVMYYGTEGVFHKENIISLFIRIIPIFLHFIEKNNQYSLL